MELQTKAHFQLRHLNFPDDWVKIQIEDQLSFEWQYLDQLISNQLKSA
jgi:hypothetical protein